MRSINVDDKFNRWVLAVRLIGLSIGLFGFARILAAGDAFGIVIAALGAVVWQCGTFLKERSPAFRALTTTLAREVMMTERIAVPNWVKVANAPYLARNEHTFLITLQAGYQSGIVLPEQIENVSEDEARYLPIAQIAGPISYVDSIRADDSLMAALIAMRRSRRDYVVVVEPNERIAGVLTRAQIDRCLAVQAANPRSIVSASVRQSAANGGTPQSYRR